MSKSDKDTLGITENGRRLLQRLKDEGAFSELVDGYRFAVALALKRELEPSATEISTTTAWNIGTFDGDQVLRDLVTVLRPDSANTPYRYIERLADAGLTELAKIESTGQMRYADLFDLSE